MRRRNENDDLFCGGGGGGAVRKALHIVRRILTSTKFVYYMVDGVLLILRRTNVIYKKTFLMYFLSVKQFKRL